MKMKARQMVKVFQDPLTELDFEGDALLIKRVPGRKSFIFEGLTYESWYVCFVDDMQYQKPMYFERLVKVQEGKVVRCTFK